MISELKYCSSIFCLIFSLVFSADQTLAQIVPPITWDKTFGGKQEDSPTSILQTKDGGYMVAGNSDSGKGGEKSDMCKGLDDFWVLKLDPSGNKVWDKTYGGNDNEELKSLIETSDGNYLIGGISISEISGDKTQDAGLYGDYWILKIDPNGNILWDKAYGGNKSDVLNTIQKTSDGGFILGGSSSSGIIGDKSEAERGELDYWIIKIDSVGNKIWDKAFGGDKLDELHAVIESTNGGYLFAGTSQSGISGDKSEATKGNRDFWVIRTDGSGNKLWDKTIGGYGGEEFSTAVQTEDGGFLLSGFSASDKGGDKSENSKGVWDFWILKIDGNGNKLWDKTFGGNKGEFLFSLTQTPAAEIILIGSTDSDQTGDVSKPVLGFSDVWILKLDSNGNKLWDKVLGGNNGEIGTAIKQTHDGGLILCGSTTSGFSGDKTEPAFGRNDYWVVKLDPDLLNSKVNFSVFPNPSTGKFKFFMNNPDLIDASITITDLVGRVVFEQHIKFNNMVSEQINLTGKSGVFIMKIKSGSQLFTEKIVIE